MNYYRLISLDTLGRAPMDGLKGNRETQRTYEGQAMVERAEGFATNERWITHSEALEVVATWDNFES